MSLAAAGALVVGLLLAEASSAPYPTRDEAARGFSCPAGTVRVGAAPPQGFECWCERPDEAPQRRRAGPARTWYDDGGLARATAFDRGLPEGTFLEWHRNGKLARAGSYRAGEREGPWLVWFESGEPEEACGYLRGRQHGHFATWWPNGRRRVEGRYCHGIQCGAWTTWDEQGHELGKMTYEEIRATP